MKSQVLSPESLPYGLEITAFTIGPTIPKPYPIISREIESTKNESKKNGVIPQMPIMAKPARTMLFLLNFVVSQPTISAHNQKGIGQGLQKLYNIRTVAGIFFQQPGPSTGEMPTIFKPNEMATAKRQSPDVSPFSYFSVSSPFLKSCCFGPLSSFFSISKSIAFLWVQ